MRAEEGDESIDEYADEAKKAKQKVENATEQPPNKGADVGPSGQR